MKSISFTSEDTLNLFLEKNPNIEIISFNVVHDGMYCRPWIIYKELKQCVNMQQKKN
jgi:hypothetical protein